jgi:hypothetical protein
VADSGRAVVIRLDAFDADIALDLIGQGRLPALAALLASTTWARTITPPGMVVGAIWPTITTGYLRDPRLRSARHRGALTREIVERFGPYTLPHKCDDFAGLRDALVDGAELKARVMCQYLDRDEWGFFFACSVRATAPGISSGVAPIRRTPRTARPRASNSAMGYSRSTKPSTSASATWSRVPRSPVPVPGSMASRSQTARL